MHLAASASVALIALSTATLAQVAASPGAPESNMVVQNAAEPENAQVPVRVDGVDSTRNMLSDSASPPPAEPK